MNDENRTPRSLYVAIGVVLLLLMVGLLLRLRSEVKLRHVRELQRALREAPPEQRSAELHADDFLVVAHVEALVGERGVAPDDLTAAGRLARLDDVRPVDLLVALRRQVREDQVALVGEQDEALALANEEDRPEDRILVAER